MIRIFALALALFASIAFAQSNVLTYTEEFAGSSLQSGSIGALGWNAEGTAVFDHTFASVPNVHNAGFTTIGLVGPGPKWGALVLGSLNLIGNENRAIPAQIHNDTWIGQWTFLVGDGPLRAQVGFFIPSSSGQSQKGCYVEFDSAVDVNFKYVCERVERMTADSGVRALPRNYYTLRIRGQLGGMVQMSITRAGINTAEDEASQRSVPTDNLFRDLDTVPAFQLSGSDGGLVADYFFFELQKVRR